MADCILYKSQNKVKFLNFSLQYFPDILSLIFQSLNQNQQKYKQQQREWLTNAVVYFLADCTRLVSIIAHLFIFNPLCSAQKLGNQTQQSRDICTMSPTEMWSSDSQVILGLFRGKQHSNIIQMVFLSPTAVFLQLLSRHRVLDCSQHQGLSVKQKLAPEGIALQQLWTRCPSENCSLTHKYSL